jgi:transaldolase
VIGQICENISGPVSAEVAGIEYDQIMAEGWVLREIANSVCIKVPLAPDGLRAGAMSM